MLDSSVDVLIATALAEDVGDGDITTDPIVGADVQVVADLVVREPGVLSGLDYAAAVFAALDPTCTTEPRMADGDTIDRPPAILATVTGPARAVLTGERVALNLLQRCSGIATATRRYVDAVAPHPVEVLDTRKTAPGLRSQDRHAVRSGGGTNHRFGLFDAVLVKDNHIALAGGIRPAVEAILKIHPEATIELEVDTLDQLDEALACRVATVLLDNMSLAELRTAVAKTAGQARLEASGGITLETIAAVAATGVDAISVGALTHSVSALDIALEVRA